MKLNSHWLKAIFASSVLVTSLAGAAPQLSQTTFEYDAQMYIQEEFNLFADGYVFDPDYPNSELRIQLDSTKSYEQISFYDKTETAYGQAVAYNTLDRRWIKFKGKLLYMADDTQGINRFDMIPFRVINPAGEVSPWGVVRVSIAN
ncbi:hypothetical protein [Pseudoalteromonas byunsanensis]|uniref:Uncharacterized protein n=1 Tax=Pseudoalteromonas byunsanensis TaxID=327939 RepID=A0A1S1N1I1_9GAMM|nr:hypothetical protein [Pseudoalteromonas byunsanensis]OHU93528.1 hypothetical protein BIW53_19475 [Pseudoalteromonas byunsanensis]